ncbi:hypothetical protein HY496_02640 [Candidatus Woesearchaeota archaeon]|nr:hypothetical protein [Candidatus Woesearchaeota archaeon]
MPDDQLNIQVAKQIGDQTAVPLPANFEIKEQSVRKFGTEQFIPRPIPAEPIVLTPWLRRSVSYAGPTYVALTNNLFAGFSDTLSFSVVQSENGQLRLGQVTKNQLESYSAKLYKQQNELVKVNIPWPDSVAIYLNDTKVLSSEESPNPRQTAYLPLVSGFNTVTIYFYTTQDGRVFDLGAPLARFADGWELPQNDRPIAPSGVSVAIDANSSGPRDTNINIVRWAPNPELGLGGYKIYRRGPYNDRILPPSGLSFQLVPGQGQLTHDQPYYYYGSSKNSIGESLASSGLFAVTSGQLSVPIMTSASGVNLASGILPSGVYQYGIATIDSLTGGETPAILTDILQLDPAGSVAKYSIDLSARIHSGVNTVQYQPVNGDGIVMIPSGNKMHCYDYQGTAYSNSANPLVWALYHMDESGGSVINDASSFNRHATASGFAWHPSTMIQPSGYALFLSGVSGCNVRTPTTSLSSGCWEGWFQPSGMISNLGSLSTSGLVSNTRLAHNEFIVGDGSGINVYLDATDLEHRHKLTFKYSYNTSSGLNSDFLHSSRSTWLPDEWYHVAITWGSGLHLYLNGQHEDTSSTTTTPMTGLNFHLGTNPANFNESFKGHLKEFRYLSGTQPTSFNVSAVSSGRIETANYRLTNLSAFREFAPDYFHTVMPYGSGIVNFYYSVSDGRSWTAMTSGQNFREFTAAVTASGQIKFRADLLPQNVNFSNPVVGNIEFSFLQSSPTNGAINLAWAPVTNASGYRIYRASGVAVTSGFAPASLLAILDMPSSGNYTDLGTTQPTTGQPSFINNTTYQNNAYLIRYQSDPNAINTAIYRSTASGYFNANSLIASGTTTNPYIDTTGGPTQGTPTMYRFLSQVGRDTHKYNDGSLFNAQRYAYRISAINAFGVEGNLSQEVSTYAGDIVPPMKPTNLSAITNGPVVSLNWTAGTDVDLDYSNVYEGSALAGPFTDIGDVAGNLYSRNIGSGVTRFYYITNVDRNGNESAASDVIQATTENIRSVVQGFTNATVVQVTHNFGLYPVVQCWDATGVVFIPSGIRHLDTNRFDVTFNNQVTGSVFGVVGTSGTSTQHMYFTNVTTATLNHNFGGFPVAQFVDSLLNVRIPSGVTHLSPNALSMDFNNVETGWILGVYGSGVFPNLRYAQSFSTAVATDVNHALGKNPLTSVMDTLQQEFIPSGIQHNTNNQYTIQTNHLIAGITVGVAN